jgi:hypothetical protein
MSKKLTALYVGLVVTAACVVPSLASAANTPLLVENGTAVATGKSVEGVNVGNSRMTSSLGTVECTTVKLSGPQIIINSTGDLEIKIISVKYGGTGPLQAGAEEPACTTKAIFGGETTVTWNSVTNGLPWCLRSTSAMAEHEFQIRGNECSQASRPIRFSLDIEGIGTCVYQRTAAIPGKYTTSTTSSTLSFSEVEFTKFEGAFACPSSIKQDLTFQFRTEGTGTTLGITS